ncbi:MAG: ABC-type branched-chain amino acid transport system, periplasmic component, branched-chain amino [Candidatus Taylorbacteria bacterium]|nr:ABC-type branched-chain amino acid transport system, periplasmic component, branched-chain amino [Candidatus Taylorbacteria bacterium]
MNKKITWTIVAAAVIILLAFLMTTNNTPHRKTMHTIGVISPLTGWGAYWGEGYNKGIALAVDEIRAKGGNVDVVIEDGGTDAQKSATAAQKLINIDKVNALTVEFAGPSSSVSPIALKAGIPLVYDAVVKKFVNENPNAFKFYFDVAKQCGIAGDYLAEHGSKNIALVSINLDFAPECQTALDAVAIRHGIKVTPYLFGEDMTDFKTTISKMKTAGVDSIIPVFYEDHAVSFFKQKGDLRFNVPVFTGLGIPDVFTEKVRSSVATSSLEGVITFDQPLSTEFKSNIQKKYPAITEKDFIPAAYGYDEIIYLYGGMSKCAQNDTSCIVSEMKKDAHKGALQSAGFGDDRIFDMDPVYYRYSGGKLVEFPLK